MPLVLKPGLAPQEAAPPASPPVVRPRLEAIDLLRGLVIVLMALDHTRDFFSSDTVDPVDLARSSPVLFITRWLTHYCAPVFIFLAGTGAFLYGSRGKSTRELSWFLFTRGLWLVLLELTYVRCLGWTFNFQLAQQGPGVLWAIGWSMVILSGLVFLPLSAVAAFGLLLVALHNQFDALKAADMGSFGWLWALTHSCEPVAWTVASGSWLPHWEIVHPESWPADAKFSGVIVGCAYGLIPWSGVMALGYGLGAMYRLDQATRRRQLYGLGFALIAAFAVLRASGVYFDPMPWQPFDAPWRRVLSFVNCNKYPPSLLYLLMTLGPALVALAAFDRPAGLLGKFFLVFGRVPLFFYLLHLPVLHGLALGISYWRHGYVSDVWFDGPPGHAPGGDGFPLPVVYLLWVGVVLALFPLCWAYGKIKRRHPAGWLSYL